MTKTVMVIISISVRIYEIITFVHFQTRRYKIRYWDDGGGSGERIFADPVS